MAHTLGGTTLYVTRDQREQPVIAPELDVLDSTKTTVQHFSKPSPKRVLTAIVITRAVLDTIEGYASGSTSKNYTSDEGSQGNWFVSNVRSERHSGRPSGFDGSSPTDSVWEVSITLTEDTP